MASDRSGNEIDRPTLSGAAVDSAAYTARVVTTSLVLNQVHPDGVVNDDYPYVGFWAHLTSSLEARWRISKKEHRESPEPYDQEDATGQTRLVTDGGRDRDDDLARIADALELQNALLLQLIQDRERDRTRNHPDPDHTGRSDHATATDVVDAYGDLYGGSIGWEFDPVSDQVENMGDSR
ncbi:hypothetical protein [Halorubrum cibi]|uniref:Uncharacterized protein n=1 Tax=Halorubrum cibi TaxID=413815 RepID=A0A521DED3_9EURY|nr:hypothetical protein [Halorubrum cibi]SMO69955.1 hypothetical protein SAMN06264867_106219 [Halorubrum cibi]